MGRQLRQAQKETLLALVNTYKDIFSAQLGRTPLIQHHIRTDGAKPIRLRPYHIPEARRRVVEKEVEEMLRDDIIENSHSPWCSPIVLVPKPNGSRWFLVDFSQLNALSHFDSYPMPGVDEMI